MKQGNDGTLELGTPSSVYGGWAEGFPYNIFTNIGGDEEADATAEAVPLLEELIEREDDEASAEELGDNDEGIAGTDSSKVAVHAANDVGNCLADRDEDSKELLRSLEQGPVFLDVVVDLDDAGSGKELHDEAGRDDGADAKLHQSPAVGGHDDSHPVEGIGGFGALDAVDGNLAAYQEDE
mmetsp:Transcript_30928/g.62763  ORF Transcript_30928/g.62763 Transcript_30928/m.62763 type:complete len:181 (-) Transcript_30928:220-762(-)